MRPAVTLGLVLLAACVSAPPTQVSTPEPPTPAVATVPPTEEPSNVTVPDEIVLWVAPHFAPDSGSRAGDLFAEHLRTYEAQHPGTRIIVRTKAEKGPAGLIESLAAASRGAPTALPDLVTLDSGGIRSATLSGLLMPFQEADPSDDLYSFASEASQIDGVQYGQPFASDSEAFAYELEGFGAPPLTWTDLEQSSFLIAAADPEAIFIVAQYLALGGELGEDLGLDRQLLTDVFAFLANAAEGKSLSSVSLELSSSEETWLALLEKRAGAAQVPYGAFVFSYDPGLHAAGPLPTERGLGIALGTPWSWAVTDREHPEAALQLIDWLSEPEFLSRWTHALGLLPTQPEVLARWPDSPEASIASRLVSVAVAMPSDEILKTIGPPLSSAIQSVLLGQATPGDAAAAAVQEITQR